MKYENMAHVAFNIKDMEKALRFYCDGLGLKYAYSMTYDTLYERLKEVGAPEVMQKQAGALLGKPWHVYLEITEGQFLELFYTYEDEPLATDMAEKCGYQHLCLQVKDIHAAWDEVVSRGITPESEIRLGCDQSYQFWVADPDGNRIELMQYTENSHQLHY